MSFKKMRVEDLYNMATNQFGVEVLQTATKPQIIAALEQNGVTWAMAKQFDPAAAQLDAEEQAIASPVETVLETHSVTLENDGTVHVEGELKTKLAPPVLIKMSRDNPTYNIRGYKFTREHPFVLVSPEDANYICTHEDGFSMATPAEAAAYYA